MRKLIYGTLRECVDELWKIVSRFPRFPRVDYAVIVDEEAKSADEAYDSAEGWFGFKDVGYEFDCDTISLFFAHYGGGGITAVEIDDHCYEDEQKEILMQRIGESTDSCGYGVLEPGDLTVFEVKW